MKDKYLRETRMVDFSNPDNSKTYSKYEMEGNG